MFNMAGAVFFWCTILFMGNMFNVVLIFQAERPVFLREQANQMYTIRAYYLAKNMIETPPALVLPTLSLLIIYWSVGFSQINNPEEFFQILLVGFLLINCAIGYGYFVSAAFKDIIMANNVAPLFLMPCLLFGGFFVNSASYPWWLAWIRFTSPVYYAFSAILIAQWRKGPVEGQEALDFLVGGIGYWNCIYMMMILIALWRFAAYLMLKANVNKFQ